MGQTGTARDADLIDELEAKFKATVTRVRPHVERAFRRMDEAVDAAANDVRPKAEAAAGRIRREVDEATRKAGPKVDGFVADVQPKLDSLLVRLQHALDRLREMLERRAARASEGTAPEKDAGVEDAPTT